MGGKDAIVAIPTRPVISISSLISMTDVDGEEIQSIDLDGKKPSSITYMPTSNSFTV